MRHELIVGVERRRFWPDEMKLSILREVDSGGATVTDVALRHEVTRHIFQLRRQMKNKGLWPEPDGITFLAQDASEQPVTSFPQLEGSLPAEIGFADGRTLRCSSDMAEAGLMRLIRLVETA